MDTEERKNDKMLFSLLRKLRKSTKLVDNQQMCVKGDKINDS